MPLCGGVMIWRATKNALAGLLAGLAGGLLLGALALIGWAAIISLVEGAGNWEHVGRYVVVAVLVFVLLPWVVQGLAQLQRSRIRSMLGTEIPVPARSAGPGRWLAGPWLDGRTWCQLGYHVLAVVTGFAGALLAVLFPVLPGLAGRFTQADLGLARERFDAESEPVRTAIAAAHDEAVLALTELREFIRGLHPAVLSDRGLVAALSGLAARAPLPVRLQVDVPRPASAAVEAVAYFIVSEALANVTKHAQASQAEVAGTRAGDV